MAMQLNSEFVIFVTHVEAEEQYLKIWGQTDKNSATCVERMILPFFEQFARGHGCPGPQASGLTINALCCARFQNEGYYRARVCSIRPDGMVVLQFIDYGNVEVLPQNEIHLLKNIIGSETLQSLPPVAYEFTLANVLPIGGVWDNKMIETIKKTLWYNEYKAICVSIIGNYRLIKLRYNNEDFAELLIKKHMALPATIQDMFRPQCMPMMQPPAYHMQNHKAMNENMGMQPMQNTQNVPFNALQNQGIVPQGAWPHAATPLIPQQKIVTQPPVQEALVFKSRVLDVGSQHDVYVSYVEDGPQKFSVQVQSTSEILSKLMRDINAHPTEPLQEPPLPGSVCLGRYTRDKVLCRAVVMAVMENNCKLYYVDFGHSEVLPYTDIFQLPPQYINPRVLSIRFTLSGVKELNVTREMAEYFKKIVSGTSLVLHVRPPEGPPLIQYGDLYDKGTNIKDILKAAFAVPSAITPVVSYQEPRLLGKDMEEIVHVSFVESCKKFFVQFDSSVTSLESIMVCLTEYAKTAPLLTANELVIGAPCAALYDSQWYRAKIIKIDGDKIKVFYVDYGNEETVNASSLRTIHNDLVTKLPAQAVKCVLNGHETLPTDQEFYNQFELLILEKRLYMRVVDKLTDSLLVDLYDPARMDNIKNKLCRMFSIDMNSYVKSDYANVDHGNSITGKKTQSENTNKWNKRNQEDSLLKVQDEIAFQETNKPKSWRNELNGERQNDRKYEKSTGFRDTSQHERFNRDASRNVRTGKDESYIKHNYNDSNLSFREKRDFRGRSRGGRPFGGNRFDTEKTFLDSENFLNRSNRSFGNDFRGNRFNSDRSLSDKDSDASLSKAKPFGNDFRSNRIGSDRSVSDKDSDTSSRGSSKRGRGGGGGFNRRGNRGGGRPRSDGISARLQSNRWNDNEASRDGQKSARVNGRFNQGMYSSKRKMNHDGVTSSRENWNTSPPRINFQNLKISSPSISLGAIRTCTVVYVNSPTDFFVHLHPDYTKLDIIMTDIASIYETGGDLLQSSKIQPDTYCIAQYTEDLQWYRAKIKSVNMDNAVVQFIDYGNIESIDFEKIKVIKDEFLKLPAQAAPCKLFAVENQMWTPESIESFTKKTEEANFEAEFVCQENGVYEVMLRELVDEVPSSSYINEKFVNAADLMKAKEAAVERIKISGTMKQLNECDYASFDSKWAVKSYEPGSRRNVIITWFINPNNFYCQITSNETEFRSMMNEIQKIYTSRKPVTDSLQAGRPVIALFSDDKALYRAEILETNKAGGYVVQYIDFGNCAVVEKNNIYPVEKKLMQLPKQAFHSSLKNVVPYSSTGWTEINTEAIDACFNADKYECLFQDRENEKYIISLNNSGEDVADILIKKGLARYAETNDTITDNEFTTKVEVHNENVETKADEIERVDISLLSGQILRIKVSSVENASKFYIQLPSATETNNIINSYMVNKDPKVMRQLSPSEICLGAGCLVYASGMWKRAMVVSTSRPAKYGVKLIDTGTYGEILPKCMLALPGELSMQNQAIECGLQNASVFENSKQLKEAIENKEVIIYIEEVDNNRLVVKLYDLLGNAITDKAEVTEKICPICPMPILTSTHKVIVSYADHSASIWLQFIADYEKDAKLTQVLNDLYPSSGKILNAEVGSLCVAKGNDGRWYRAKVVNLTEKGAFVKYIDYGNTQEIDSNSLFELDAQLYQPHQLAINASLTMSLNGTYSEQIRVLQEHVSNKELTAVFYNINKQWTVELFDGDEKLSDRFQQLNLFKSTTQSEDFTLTVGKRYNVIVSHTDSPSQFWITLVDELQIFEQKSSDLQMEASSYPVIQGIPEEGTLCAAVYSIDNMWYRAEVLDADEDITTVRFVDYGNTDVIDNKSQNIRELSETWKSLKKYATKCRLDVIPIESEDWSEVTCERFNNLVINAESLEALIISDGTPKRVELFINNRSVSEILVEEHHASKIHAEEELIDEIVELELDPHSAFVSHINSPSEFWVQEEKSVTDLEVMSDRFMVADMFPKMEKIEENLLCVAKYPEDDQWYRARVVSHNDGNIKVIYIDYGNSAVSTEIRAIPEDLAKIPPLSRKCSLALPEGIEEWSEEACDEFIKLAADGATIFLLDVLKDGDSSLVRLTLNGKNVVDLLATYCERHIVEIEERLPPLGEENSPNVVVSHVNTPSEFWIQEESSIAELEIMSDRLRAAPSFLPLNSFEKGTICAAVFPEDKQWYRAKILSEEEQGVNVLYIDYGNTAITTDLRVLPEDIVNIPVLSKRCTLKTLTDDISWSEEACKKFKELAAEGATMFQFENFDENDPMHVKLSTNDKDVAEILLRLHENLLSQEFTFVEQANEKKFTEKTKEQENKDSYEPNKELNSSNNEDNKNYSLTNVKELSIDEIVSSMINDLHDNDEIEEINSNNTSHEKVTETVQVTGNKEIKVVSECLEENQETQKIKEMDNNFENAINSEKTDRMDSDTVTLETSQIAIVNDVNAGESITNATDSEKQTAIVITETLKNTEDMKKVLQNDAEIHATHIEASAMTLELQKEPNLSNAESEISVTDVIVSNIEQQSLKNSEIVPDDIATSASVEEKPEACNESNKSEDLSRSESVTYESKQSPESKTDFVDTNTSSNFSSAHEPEDANVKAARNKKCEDESSNLTTEVKTK